MYICAYVCIYKVIDETGLPETPGREEEEVNKQIYMYIYIYIYMHV